MSIAPRDLTDLRRELIERRAALAERDRAGAAAAIAAAAEEQEDFTAAETIAVYFAVRGEADPGRLAELARKEGKRLFLPALCGRSLVFREWTEHTELRAGSFGIPEPVDGTEQAPSDLDLVLAPLVAFDDAGHRVGMGGGFYDRTFAFLKDASRRADRPRLVGVAYEFQCLDELPVQPWDVPLDGVVTEAGWRTFRR